MSGEVKKEDIDEMLRRINKEIASRERSIDRLEKQLANAKERLAILKGRKSQYDTKALMRDYDVQSIDDLRKLLDDAHIKKADVNSSATTDKNASTKASPFTEADGKETKEAAAETDNVKKKKADEPAADYSKMW